jgi:hypothetical protein
LSSTGSTRSKAERSVVNRAVTPSRSKTSRSPGSVGSLARIARERRKEVVTRWRSDRSDCATGLRQVAAAGPLDASVINAWTLPDARCGKTSGTAAIAPPCPMTEGRTAKMTSRPTPEASFIENTPPKDADP